MSLLAEFIYIIFFLYALYIAFNYPSFLSNYRLKKHGITLPSVITKVEPAKHETLLGTEQESKDELFVTYTVTRENSLASYSAAIVPAFLYPGLKTGDTIDVLALSEAPHFHRPKLAFEFQTKEKMKKKILHILLFFTVLIAYEMITQSLVKTSVFESVLLGIFSYILLITAIDILVYIYTRIKYSMVRKKQ